MSDDKSKGKFDHYSHDQLYAMVANSNPDRLSDVAHALEEAFGALDSISNDLKVYFTQVKLEGEGGKAFHTWGEKTVMQTAKLAHYVSSAGEAMKKAGEGLAKAKSAMPKPDMMCYADPEKDKARLKKRDEAADLLVGLDNYYGIVNEDLRKLEEPTFVPPPGVDNSITGSERSYGTSAGGGGSSAGDGVGGGARGVSFSNSVGSNGTHEVLLPQGPGGTAGRSGIEVHPDPGAPDSGAVGSGPRRAPETRIDSVGIAPPPESILRPDLPTPPLDASRQSISPLAPPVTLGPNLALPRVPSEGGAHRFDSGARPERGLPSPRPGATPPVGARDGIVGGTPSRPVAGSVAPRLPRGTVIGEERGSMNRGPMGMGGFSGLPGGGAPGHRVPAAGRRLATEPGGTAGAPRAPRGGPGEFTPGGTGLVRGNQGMGMLPPTGVPSGNDARHRNGKRPDYLVEDEETWTEGRRDTVPPVIG
ncbi:hypothetical protein [Streptomyces albireticuli]|uniref:hypothetical protein n=1 Tax=Streptomyces albireticuli TaxID=1940 RepID=UPI00117C4790|nr:hypothetical protein [Streptomyces albireticuli]MCD9143998.1 hypothetical protein [Streptomyces albireticuli]MCD9162359.1 hypothetical protein [Streptomyces albireticuli]MCD9195472.1 hypothetical protein [Streptomyces albireticuli]